MMKKIILIMVSCMLTLSLSAKKDGKEFHDIHYREAETEYMEKMCLLDLYVPQGVEQFPTLVWFHGGGLTGGHRYIPEELKNAGIAIVSVEYRLLPDCKFDDCIDDAAAAVAWTFRKISTYGGDIDKIYVSGHSAGGYLTNMLGLEKKWLAEYGVDADEIAGLFPISGHAICHFSYRKELGIKDTQALVDETAPLYHVRPDAAPLVLISGDRNLEMLGRYEEQAYFWRMLKVVGHPHVHLYEIGGFDHGEVVQPAFHIIKNYISGKLKF